MEISEIHVKIGHLRRRLKAISLVRGSGGALISASGACLFLFAADYFLILPAGARVVLLACAAAVVAFTAYRKVLAPAGRRITDDEVALRIEQAFPALGEKLISAVQFDRRKGADFDVIQSREMVEAVTAEAVAETRDLPLGTVAGTGGAAARFGLGAAAAAAVAAAGLLNPGLASVWLNRVAGGSMNWPQRTEITVLEPQSADCRLSRGENLPVKVKIGKEVPSKVRVLFEFLESGDEGEADMVRLDATTFQYFFPNVVSDFRFSVKAGDAESALHSVKVLVPPKLSDLRAKLAYPAYTKMSGKPEGEWDQADGNVKAPVGTQVMLDAGSTKPLKSASILFSKKGLAEIPARIMEDGRIRASFEVSTDTTYSIVLIGKEGESNRIPARFSIKAVPDQPPLVNVTWPRFNEQVTDQAVMPVRGTMKDDYGVASARMLLRRAAEKPDSRQALDVGVPAAEFGEKEFSFEKQVEIQALRLPSSSGAASAPKEGDVFLLLLEAYDFRPSPSPNSARTREVQIEVVSKVELERTIESRMIALRDRLSRIKSAQEDAVERLSALREALGEQQVWSREDLEGLLGSEIAQRRVSSDSVRANADFLAIIDTVVFNKLGDPDYVRTLREMAELIDLAAGEKSQQALKSIENARTAAARADQLKASADAIESQNQVVKILSDVLDRMRKWEDMSELIREMRELRDAQKKILDKTNGIIKEGDGGKDGRK